MRRMRCSRVWCVGVAVMLLAVSAWSVDIAVNPAKEFQTIEGFGAHGSMVPWWEGGPHYNDAFIRTVIDDMGLTMLRNEYYPSGDPQCDFNKQKPYLQAMDSYAKQHGVPLRFITSLWSPPAYMKTNNSIKDGGNLKTTSYTEFGDYLLNAIRAYKDIGIDLYALSIQNEPEFSQFYNSCVYSDVQYRDALKAVGPRIRSEFPNVKMFGPETMLAGGNLYIRATLQDPEARKHLDVIAYHGYSDGVRPSPTTIMSTMWRQTAGVAANHGMDVWMTETSGYSENWGGAFELAGAIYAALYHGNMSAWVWWQLSERGMSEYVLMNNGTPGIRYYASKQFYRYIRPGAVRIESESPDEDVYVVAFNDKSANQFVAVALNYADESKTISFSNPEVPAQLRMIQTTASDRTADQGLKPKTGISLPPSSVVTLVGDNFAPSTAVSPRQTQTAGRIAVASGAYTARIYGLDGTLVRTIENVRVGSDGRFSWDRLSDAGSAVAAGAYRTVLTGAGGAAVAGPMFIN